MEVKENSSKMNQPLDMEAIMLNMDWCDLPFHNQDMLEFKCFESPEKTESTLLSDSSIVDDYFPLSSTLQSNEDDCMNIDVSVNKLLNSSDNPDPATSTPEHEIRRICEKYKMKHPPNLVIEEASDEEDEAIVDVHKCSPVRSPFPSIEEDLDKSFLDLDETPHPVHYDEPPSGFQLHPRLSKMVALLKRFGLSHFAFIFAEQEIDIELFLTLTNEDLKEIGIERKTDRQILLSVIEECNRRY